LYKSRYERSGLIMHPSSLFIPGFSDHSANGSGDAPPLTDPHYSNVHLLMSMDGVNNSTNFVNSKTNNLATVVGNTKIVTDKFKSGSSSAYFDGSGDSLYFPGSEVSAGGNTNFTIEGYIYPTTASEGILFTTYNIGDGSQHSAIIAWRSVLQLANIFVINQTIASNIWQHYAITRFGNTWRVFVDGILQGSAEAAASISQGNRFHIGGSPGDNNIGGVWFTGYMDDIRVTYGIARYIDNFIPPTTPYPTS